MIQPLRAMHRWTFTSLAVLLPAVFVAGLAARHELQVDSPRTPEMRGSIPRWTHRHAVAVELRRGTSASSIMLHAQQPLLEPDVLVYCAPSGSQETEFPNHVALLGEFRSGTTFELPRDFRKGCRLTLFSAATGELIDSAEIGVAQ